MDCPVKELYLISAIDLPIVAMNTIVDIQQRTMVTPTDSHASESGINRKNTTITAKAEA